MNDLPGARRALSILVLYSQIETVNRGDPLDIISAQENMRVADEISTGLRGLGYRVASVGVADDVARAIAPYAPGEWLIFNLCESPNGDPALEPSVPPVLEAHGFIHTGSSGQTISLCLDKARAKAFLAAQGLATPRFAVLSSADEACDVPLPAMVKPLSEDASIGITSDSVVCNFEGLRRQVGYVLECYQQPALVEEFIGGREFNVAIWGNDPPQPLPISEICYQGIEDPLQRFLTYEAKWMEDSDIYRQTPGVCPTQIDPALEQRLIETALAAYKLVGCHDYARVDLRERDGIPYILEINPNPTLASDAGFYRAARAAGFDQAHMAERIVRSALARNGL